jgi:hypothetical protein
MPYLWTIPTVLCYGLAKIRKLIHPFKKQNARKIEISFFNAYIATICIFDLNKQAKTSENEPNKQNCRRLKYNTNHIIQP